MRALPLAFTLFTLAACSSAGTGGTTTASTGTGGTAGPGGASSATTGAGGATAMACTAGAEAALPACANPATTSIDVPSGCIPTVDGAYHQGEWSDAACIVVENDPIYVKYAGDTLYLAWPMKPMCGCPAQLAFNTDGASALDGKQIDLGIFDDPGSATGDSSEFHSQSGAWSSPGTVAGGIVIANPPMSPPLVTYEISIPFAALGITPGKADTVGFAINHPMSGVWPKTLASPMGGYQPENPSQWGKLTSSTDWK